MSTSAIPNFSALASQATAMITEAAAPAAGENPTAAASPASVPAPATSPTPAAGTVTPPQSQSLPVTQDPAATGQPAGEQTFKVKFENGREETLTETQIRELYNGGLRQQDYTHKTQELARQRQELDQQAAYVQQLASNPGLLAQELAKAYQQHPPNQPQPTVDPNAPVTVGQLQSLFTNYRQQVQQESQQLVQDQLQVAQYAVKVNDTLNTVKAENPFLSSMPEYEDMIRYKVLQLKPQTEEEAVAAIKAVAKDMVTGAQTQFAAQQQQAAATRSQMVATGSEAPGGVAPQQQAPSYMKRPGREIDWSRLKDGALNIASQGN